MKVVVDASVVVKWLLPDPRAREPVDEKPPNPREPHVDEAVELLKAIRSGKLTPFQPPHWLAETAAVITRLHPEIAQRSIEILDAMEVPVVDGIHIYRRAVAIGRELRHHVFDTLYHAVALEEDATLITADDAYWRKARHLGSLVRLELFVKDSIHADPDQG